VAAIRLQEGMFAVRCFCGKLAFTERRPAALCLSGMIIPVPGPLV
jgi:hypothetical protein